MYLQRTLLEKSEKFPMFWEFLGQFLRMHSEMIEFLGCVVSLFFGLEKIKVVTKITQPKDYEIKV